MIKVHRIVNSVFSSNTYCITPDYGVDMWLVDCGDVKPIVEYSEKNKKIIVGVLLTHTHFDHIYGLSELISLYPFIKIYSTSWGIKALKDSELNLSCFNDTEYTYNCSNVEEIGSDLNICSCFCKSHPVPGHDPSCIAFQIGKFLFTGDSYIPNNKVVTFWPNSNKTEAILSDNLLQDILKKNHLVACPGHGEMDSYDNYEKIN